MPFQKDNKYGGSRENSGRPTREEAEQKRLEADKARAIIEKHAERLATRYIKRALAQKADKVLMHAIDKLVPAAKQQLELSGGLKIIKVNAFDPDAE